MSNLKIELGSWYKTCNGDKAYAAYVVPRVIRGDVHKLCPIVMHVFRNNTDWALVSVNNKGFGAKFGFEWQLDAQQFIVSRWEEPGRENMKQKEPEFDLSKPLMMRGFPEKKVKFLDYLQSQQNEPPMLLFKVTNTDGFEHSCTTHLNGRIVRDYPCSRDIINRPAPEIKVGWVYESIHADRKYKVLADTREYRRDRLFPIVTICLNDGSVDVVTADGGYLNLETGRPADE